MWDRLWEFYDSSVEGFNDKAKSASNSVTKWVERSSKNLLDSARNQLSGLLEIDVKHHLRSTSDSVVRWMDIDVLQVRGKTVQSRHVVWGVVFLGGILTVVFIVRKTRKGKKLNTKHFMKGMASWTNNGIEGLRMTSDLLLPDSIPSDHVLIRVEAASVDQVDIRILYGYGGGWIRKSEGKIPGRDCSGVVVKMGSDVRDLDVGDKVWAFSSPSEQGLMSEFACLPTSRVSAMPYGVSFAEAASIPYSSILTWEALCIHGGIGPTNTEGKRVLVHIGSSPCGCLAIQLVKAWGGHVTATVPTAGLPMARLLGADDVVVFSVTDFQDELKTKDKYDVVLNTVMGSTLLHGLCLELCAEGGRVVSTSNPFPGLDDPTVVQGLFPAFLHFVKTVLKTMIQVVIPSEESRHWKHFTFDKEVLEHFRELIETGELEPIVEEVFTLKDGVRAFQRVATGDTVGKTVIKLK